MALNGSYPAYSASNNPCRFNNSISTATPRPNGIKYPIKLNNNETALAEVVKAYGPVSVAISVNFSWSLYLSGIYFDTSCTGQYLNHAVLCVGRLSVCQFCLNFKLSSNISFILQVMEQKMELTIGKF